MSEITLKELKKALQEAINNLEEKEKAISVGSLEKKENIGYTNRRAKRCSTIYQWRS